MFSSSIDSTFHIKVPAVIWMSGSCIGRNADGFYLYHNSDRVFWIMRLVLQGMGKAMIDMVIGFVGLILIVYLFIAVLKPEKF